MTYKFYLLYLFISITCCSRVRSVVFGERSSSWTESIDGDIRGAYFGPKESISSDQKDNAELRIDSWRLMSCREIDRQQGRLYPINGRFDRPVGVSFGDSTRSHSGPALDDISDPIARK